MKPTLSYSWLRQDAVGVAIKTGSPSLADVNEVSASETGGQLRVYAYGRVLKKDGTPGRCRHVELDLSVTQPPWLERLMADAWMRLDVLPANPSFTKEEQ